MLLHLGGIIFMEKNTKQQSAMYGYVRISDKSQKTHRQMDFMQELNIPIANIFIDKMSGKNFERPEYRKLYRKLKAGDTLYIKELDRLGRNKTEIKEELNKLHNKKVRVRITNIPTTMHDFGEDDWILDMVNNILVEVLSAFAEQERLTNHQRQAEGIASAKARGVKFGRPFLQLPDNFSYYYEAWENKKLSVKEITECLNIDRVKFYSYVRSYRKQFHVQ